MKLTAFDIPESQSDLPVWIESQVTQGDLRSLVAQLAAVSQVSKSPQESDGVPNLDELLGNHRGAVLESGLSALPSDTLFNLLSDPGKLLLLQELTMVHGGDYWLDRYRADSSYAAEIEAGRAAIDATFDPSAAASIDRPDRLANTDAQMGVPTTGELGRWLAVAASLALAVGVWVAMTRGPANRQIAQQQEIQQQEIQQPATDRVDGRGSDGQPVEGIGWGWASEKGVPSDLSSNEYLGALAVGAASWGKKQPADKAGLLKRLQEFRAGCNRLANMEHPSLDAAEQQWLISHCQDWLAEIDALIESSPSLVFADMKEQADSIAAKMESLLSEKATA